MTSSLVALVREAALLVLLLAAPLLVAALIAGIVTGLIGAFTQIQDPAIGMAPRVAAVGIALAMFAPSIAGQVDRFANRLWPLVVVVGTGGGESGSDGGGSSHGDEGGGGESGGGESGGGESGGGESGGGESGGGESGGGERSHGRGGP
jgi:flagellar biosynthesis protein FliQ